MEDALDIAGEDIVEFLFPEVFKRPFPIDARRIDEHIEAAKVRHRPFDHAAAVLDALHIPLQEADSLCPGLLREACRCLTAALLGAPHQADTGTFLQEFTRRFQSDAGSAAREQDNL